MVRILAGAITNVAFGMSDDPLEASPLSDPTLPGMNMTLERNRDVRNRVSKESNHGVNQLASEGS